MIEPTLGVEWRWCGRDDVPEALFTPTRMALDLLDDLPVVGALAAYRLAPREVR